MYKASQPSADATTGTFGGMWRRYRAHLLLFVLALAGAQGWNRWNIAVMLRSPAAANVRDGGSLTAVDDASHLQWVERLLGNRPDLEQGIATRLPDLRPPGYGLWYLLLRAALPPRAAIHVLVLLQTLLFALAVALLHEALLRHGIAPAIRWPLLIALAVMPTFHGFLFHLLSEGVTPTLTLALLSCALLDARSEGRRWLWAGLALWALLLLTRPVLGWAGAALLPGLARQGRWRAAALIALAAAPLLGWWAANCIRAGHLVGLHPVYHAATPGINRPTHAAFWALAKSWGARGSHFHQAMERAFQAALRCDTSAAYARHYIALAPPSMLSGDQEARIREAFRRWQRFTCAELAPAIASPAGTIAFTTREEQGIIRSLSSVTSEWRAQHPFHHHVMVPLRVLKEMILHSNLNLWMFQHTWRGRPWMEALRWLSAGVHAAALAAAALAFLFPAPPPVRLISLGCLAYLLFLAYVQRGVEERYTLPVLFVGVACAAFMVGRKGAKAQRTR